MCWESKINTTQATTQNTTASAPRLRFRALPLPRHTRGVRNRRPAQVGSHTTKTFSG